MAFYELMSGGSFGISDGKFKATRKFICEGAASEQAALTEIGIHFGDIYPYGDYGSVLACNSIQANPIQQHFEVSYGYNDTRSPASQPNAAASESTTVEHIGIGTQTKKMMIAPTIKFYFDDSGTWQPTGTPAYEVKPINVGEDKKADGVDYLAPQYTYELYAKFTAAQFTQAYRGIIFNLVGKVNAAPFNGTAAKETLFLGCDAEKKVSVNESGDSVYTYSATFKFMAYPNLETIADIKFYKPSTKQEAAAGGAIPVKGHEYIWTLPMKNGAVSGDYVADRMCIKELSVCEIYKSGDFTKLALSDVDGGH